MSDTENAHDDVDQIRRKRAEERIAAVAGPNVHAEDVSIESVDGEWQVELSHPAIRRRLAAKVLEEDKDEIRPEDITFEDNDGTVTVTMDELSDELGIEPGENDE